MCTPHRARAPTRSLEACRSGVGTCVGTWCVRSPMERRGWQFTRGAPRRLLLLNKYVVSLDRFFRTPAKPSRSPPAQGRERIERLTASRARPMRAVDTFVDTAVRVPACGTAIEPTVPPTVPPGFRGGGGRESGPAAGPGTSSRISAGWRVSRREAVTGWQHEERYRTRGGKLRTSLSRSRGYKRYRPAFPRLLYAFP